MQLLASSADPAPRPALDVLLGLVGVAVLVLILRSGVRRAGRDRRMRLRARPAVATSTDWDWDRGEDGDDLHRPIVRFTTADGLDVEGVTLGWEARRRPGEVGESFDVFYDPHDPRTVVGDAAPRHYPVVRVALAFGGIALCAWYVAAAGIGLPSPATLIDGVDRDRWALLGLVGVGLSLLGICAHLVSEVRARHRWGQGRFGTVLTGIGAALALPLALYLLALAYLIWRQAG
ncbi:DUF3592 domain-containing protein [Actinoplanes sp. NPDC049118]|uniref:DUF3592 domain-containing protein n=1 Tax=Actinoplanes sp. NPDC049118 TaxID=3155769 RepID=UPI0033CEA0D9